MDDRSTHALFVKDNWDGEGDTYWSFACKNGDNWTLISEGADKPFPEYQGDEILKVVPLSANTIDELATKQLEWLKEMNWVGQTTLLEDLMLVVSECGEAANEARGESPTPEFEIELADIVLRVMGIAAKQGISLNDAIRRKMKHNFENGKKKNRLK